MQKQNSTEFDKPYPLQMRFRRWGLPAAAVTFAVLVMLVGFGGTGLVERIYLNLAEGRAQTIVVALGSVNGTIKEVIDTMREDGTAIGSVSICSFRPFPLDELQDALKNAKRVVVIEKSLAPGLGGVVASNVRMALRGVTLPVYTVIAGLGGRTITMTSLQEVFEAAGEDRLPDLQFLDLDHSAVEHEIVRARRTRRSGPKAENILRQKAGGRKK